MKRVIINSVDFENLKKGGHANINGVKRFVEILAVNNETNEELECKVCQIGGMFNYDASIKMKSNAQSKA